MGKVFGAIGMFIAGGMFGAVFMSVFACHKVTDMQTDLNDMSDENYMLRNKVDVMQSELYVARVANDSMRKRLAVYDNPGNS